MTKTNEKMTYDWGWKIPKDMAEESLWAHHSKEKIKAGFRELWKWESKITSPNREVRLEAVKLKDADLQHWKSQPTYFFELGLKDKDPEIQAAWLKKAEHMVLPEHVLRHLFQNACPAIRETLAEREDVKQLRAKDAAPSLLETLLSSAYEKAKTLLGDKKKAGPKIP